MTASLPKLSGPKTAKGKRTSSRNATKHGLTAAHALTIEEDKRLAYLIKELNKEYQPETITERLLIDRVANIQLRLERIQNQERAWYNQARKDACDIEKVLDGLPISYDAKRAFSVHFARLDSTEFGHKLASLSFMAHRDVYLELLGGHYSKNLPTSYEAFILDYPELLKRLCMYCKMEDCEPTDLVTNFEKSPPQTTQWLADLPVLDEFFEQGELQIFENEMAEALQENTLDFKTLIEMTFGALQEKLKLETTQQQISEAMQTRPAMSGPSKEQMDQLMRYSTSLNTQFSKALGELRHVVKERNQEQHIQFS